MRNLTFEQLPNFNYIDINWGMTRSTYLESGSPAGRGVNGACSRRLQAGTQLSTVVCKMCKEPLEKMIVVTSFG